MPLQVSCGGLDGRAGERKVILMPCMAPTDQLKLSSDQLSWSAGARFGKNFCKLENFVQLETFVRIRKLEDRPTENQV